MTEKTVVLLSGGVDSTTCAYLAKSEGMEIYALSFDYGQRLRRELDAARAVAAAVGARDHIVVAFDLTLWGGAALTDLTMKVPTGRSKCERAQGVPPTYVPGRNALFLSFGLSYAESVGAKSVVVGVNAQDYGGYPDCRPEFIKAYQEAARLGTKAGLGGCPIQIRAPLLYYNKAEIIRQGMACGADYSKSWSCYQGQDTPCTTCDACLIRAEGFLSAGVTDPAT